MSEPSNQLEVFNSNSKRKAYSYSSASRVSNESTTPVRIKMAPAYRRSQCLSPELQNLREEIFNAIPQNPHFSPLQKHCSGVRAGLKLGLDVVFIKLVQKIHNLVDPVEFLADLKDYIAQLTELEEMGYDVAKVWERFDALRRIAEQEKILRDKIVDVEMEVKNKETKVGVTKSRILELEAQIIKLKDGLRTQKFEIDTLQSRAMKIRGDSNKVVDEFASLAQARWK